MHPATDPAQERDRFATLLQATAEALHLPAGEDLNAIVAAAAAAHDAAINLRVQLDRCNAERQRLAEELAEVSMTGRVLAEVAAERERQDAKWGEQNHPDGTGWAFAGPIAGMLADLQRKTTERAAKAGQVTWRLILREEVAEASAESDPAMLRTEVVQVAAVAVQWARAIKRRAATTQGVRTDG